MRQLWAPWRLQYVTGSKEPGCVFCNALADPEAAREQYILFRDERAFVMLNRYPYNNGHLLISPVRHVADPTELPAADFSHLCRLLQASVEALRRVYSPDGFNLGMNLGACAGAGVLGHLHWHALPRWNGDTNFLPVLDDTRCIVQHLDSCWEALAPHFEDPEALLAKAGEEV